MGHVELAARGVVAWTVAYVNTITAADIEAVLATDLRRYAKESRALRALLTDVATALRTLAADNEQLHRDIERIKAARRASGTPLAAAVEAVAELGYEERQQLFSVEAAALIDALNTELSNVRSRQLAVASAAVRIAATLREVDPAAADEVLQLAHGSATGQHYVIDFDPYTVEIADTLFTDTLFTDTAVTDTAVTDTLFTDTAVTDTAVTDTGTGLPDDGQTRSDGGSSVLDELFAKDT